MTLWLYNIYVQIFDNIWQINKTSFWYPLWKSTKRTYICTYNQWDQRYYVVTNRVRVMVLYVFNNISRKKPSTCRQPLTNFSVTNNVIHNIVAMPDFMFNILTFDTNGQHSTWLYDKGDGCSFTFTHFPQNSIIPTVWSLIITP